MAETNSANGNSTEKGDQLAGGIGLEIHEYTKFLDGLRATLAFGSQVWDQIYAKARNELLSFINSKCRVKNSDSGSPVYTIPGEHYEEYHNLQSIYDDAEVGMIVTPRNYIVSLVIQYDQFLSRVIRCADNLQPKALCLNDAKVEFSKIEALQTPDKVREYLLESVLNKLLYKGHYSQFEWLRDTFHINIKRIEAWIPEFVEITERRNIFVHCNGVVSSKYLSVCSQYGANVPTSLREGDEITTDSEYLRRSNNIVFLVGVCVAYLLWKQLSPKNLVDIDGHLNDIAFYRIMKGQYDLAIELLEFLLSQADDDTSHRSLHMLEVNLAQALLWKGEDKKCENILSKMDTSSLGLDLELAVAVLNRDFERAETLMHNIGIEYMKVNADAYLSWPCFKEFRQTDQFRRAFISIYDRDPESTGSTPTDVKASEQEKQPDSDQTQDREQASIQSDQPNKRKAKKQRRR